LISAAKDDSIRFTSLSTKTYGSDRIGLDGEGTSLSSDANGSLVVAASGASVHVIRNQKSVGTVATPFNSKAVFQYSFVLFLELVCDYYVYMQLTGRPNKFGASSCALSYSIHGHLSFC